MERDEEGGEVKKRERRIRKKRKQALPSFLQKKKKVIKNSSQKMQRKLYYSYFNLGPQSSELSGHVIVFFLFFVKLLEKRLLLADNVFSKSHRLLKLFFSRSKAFAYVFYFLIRFPVKLNQ